MHVHPGRAGRRRLSSPRTGLVQLPSHLRDGRVVQDPDGRRGPTAAAAPTLASTCMTWQVPRLMLGDNHAASLAERSAEVDVGQIGGPAAFIRVFPLTGIKARERATALGDFETTVVRMRYRHSATMACRRLWRCRRRLSGCCRGNAQMSGMRWTCNGATSVLILSTYKPAIGGKNLATAKQRDAAG